MPATRTSDPPAAFADESLPGRRRRLRGLLPLLLIVLVVCAAWWNAWPNALVHDDKFFGGSERFTELANIPRYFRENVWASSGISEPLYRPLLLVSISLDARAHGDWVAGYHLSNIALHALVSLLVFGFLRQSLRMAHDPPRADSLTNTSVDTAAALAVALIYAVHPVHTEVVNSIFNRSEMLVALFGLAGLIWFLRRLHARPASAWAGLGLAYLLALLCKENAIVLPGIAVVLALALTPGSLLGRVQKCLPVLWLLLPLLLYFVLRAHALTPAEFAGFAGGPPGVADAELPGVADAALPGADAMPEQFAVPDGGRIMRVAGLWYEAFKILLWPHPLSVAPVVSSPFARIAGLGLSLALVLVASWRARQGRYALAIGLAFFYIALLPASRIIGDPSTLPHLAERYLYLPSIGLALAAAFGLRGLALRFGVRALAGATLPLLLVLAPITWARNAAWASDVALFESEYSWHGENEAILVWLTAAQLVEGGFDRTAQICDGHLRVQERSDRLSMHCAVAYGRLGRLPEAERAHLFSTAGKRAIPAAHANLANFYLAQGRWREAKEQFELSIEREKVPVKRAFRSGQALVRLYPADREKLLEARGRFEQALALQPSFGTAQVWLARVNRALGDPPASQP